MAQQHALRRKYAENIPTEFKRDRRGRGNRTREKHRKKACPNAIPEFHARMLARPYQGEASLQPQCRTCPDAESGRTKYACTLERAKPCTTLPGGQGDAS